MTHRRERDSWDLVGLEDAESWRPIDSALVPKALRIDGEVLRYEYFALGVERKWPPDLLSAFAALAKGSNASILQFAKRCGVLDLCSHGLPRTHLPSLCREGAPGADPLSQWRAFAAEAHSILNAIVALKRGQSVDAADWNVVCPFLPPLWMEIPRSRPANDPASEWQRLLDVVNQWIAWADVRPMVLWDRAPRERMSGGWTFGPVHPRLEMSGGLFGALALQLAAFVTGSSGIEQCSNCGHFFAPDRRHAARRGSGRYCQNCQGTKEAAARASRAYRERKDRAAALFKQGYSVDHIATELKSTANTVAGWLKKGRRRARNGKTTRT